MGEQSSASVAIALPGKDKMTLHSRGASQLFKAADITDEMLEGVKLFHFGYPPSMKYLVENEGEELEDLLKNVKSKGITISLDMSLPDLKTFLGHVNWRSNPAADTALCGLVFTQPGREHFFSFTGRIMLRWCVRQGQITFWIILM